jgi:hypothetical protein
MAEDRVELPGKKWRRCPACEYACTERPHPRRSHVISAASRIAEHVRSCHGGRGLDDRRGRRVSMRVVEQGQI